MNNIQRIRDKLAAGGLCFGTHCSNTELDFYEMCGLLGYDYVWIDNEHAGMTQPMIKRHYRHQCRWKLRHRPGAGSPDVQYQAHHRVRPRRRHFPHGEFRGGSPAVRGHLHLPA